MDITIGQITDYLEGIAPPSLQESYDNSRLIVGDKNTIVKGVITALDCIEDVVDEAISKGFNLIVAHHPIVFGGLKSFNGKNYIERTVIKAIKNDIAIYAIHTNLDNVLHGVNGVWADHLGLTNQTVLSPKNELYKKLCVFIPEDHFEDVSKAIFNAGAGKIGKYDECGFSTQGEGSFRPLIGSNPFQGKQGVKEVVKEIKFECLVPGFAVAKVLKAMNLAHPYEEVAYDLYDVSATSLEIGSGVYGELEEPMDSLEFLKMLKSKMKTGCVKYTRPINDKIQKIAICGGSGSFLLNAAKASGADIFITSDYKYHQFFDAENEIMIADIGHFESEHLTINYLAEIIKEKFTTFAVLKTDVITNPVNYL